MRHRRHPLTLPTVLATSLLLVFGMAAPAHAVDDEPHGGTEPGTHVDVDLPDPAGGDGSGTPTRDPGTHVIFESAPPIDDGAIYPNTEDKTPAVIRTHFGGMNDVERAASGGGSGKSGDSSAGGDKTMTGKITTQTNKRAGKADAAKAVVYQVMKPSADGDDYSTVVVTSTVDLEKIATVTPVTSTDVSGHASLFAYSIVFDKSVETSAPDRIINSIFWLTGGFFSQCTSNNNYNFCVLAHGKPIGGTRSPLTAVSQDRQFPVCSNTMKDGGYGTTTVFTVADVECEAVPGKEAVRLEVGTIHSDLAAGIPSARAGDGTVVYEATREAQGTYMTAEVRAVAADGTSSLPFDIAVRNRYTPAGGAAVMPDQTGAVLPLEAIRGVDTVIPASRLFSDVDVDQHAAESGDHLTSQVVEQGALGGAWFDAHGDLHYQSIDVIRGDYTDHITVRATDSFGLPSPDLRLSIHISDIVPGCATGTTTTDAVTPVRIQLTCWITPADGWHQIDGLTYRITAQPTFGTITDLDPISGAATYTPDPGHPEPATITFTATNNGATREATHTVNVLPAP